MKNKILIGATLVVSVIAGANAAEPMAIANIDIATPTPVMERPVDNARERLKSLCDKNSDKVWVERDGVCAPKNPCDDKKYQRYCNTDFKQVQVGSKADAAELINVYVKRKGLDCTVGFIGLSSIIGQDFISCKGTDFMVFEFDDVSESFGGEAEYNFKMGYCIALGGVLKPANISDLRRNSERSSGEMVVCSAVSESECKSIGRFNTKWHNSIEVCYIY